MDEEGNQTEKVPEPETNQAPKEEGAGEAAQVKKQAKRKSRAKPKPGPAAPVVAGSEELPGPPSEPQPEEPAVVPQGEAPEEGRDDGPKRESGGGVPKAPAQDDIKAIMSNVLKEHYSHRDEMVRIAEEAMNKRELERERRKVERLKKELREKRKEAAARPPTPRPAQKRIFDYETISYQPEDYAYKPPKKVKLPTLEEKEEDNDGIVAKKHRREGGFSVEDFFAR